MYRFTIILIAILFAGCSIGQNKNEAILSQKLKLAQKSDDVATIIDKIGTSFINAPYVGHTLESEKEKLIVNLNEFDCTTFVENVLSLTKVIKNNKNSFNDFTQILQEIRYRDGVLGKYPSRLHYFTEWILNNEKKGMIKNITKEIGGELYLKEINFMSKNHDKYAQLSNANFLKEITSTEESLNEKKHHYIPKSKISASLDKLKTGDIIAFTTSIEGLDIVHVGFAYKQNDQMKLLHASSGKEKKVIKSTQNLEEYMNDKKWITGIMVARPNN